MADLTEREDEGSANSSIVFEYIDEGNIPQTLGTFALTDFLGEMEEDVSLPDDQGRPSIPEDDGLDDGNASSSRPSGIERKGWKSNLKEAEFVLRTKEEMRDFVESTRNPNTVRKTNQVVTAFQKWLKNYCNETRQIETIEPGELDAFLENYLLTKKKSKGGQHQPDTLTSIHRGILRHLKHKDYAVDPLTHDSFEMSRDVLASRRTKLKQEGMGNRPNRAESFDEEEISKMWESGALGYSTPAILQNTVYWFLAIGLGLRGCDESRSMKWGDVVLLEDKDGIEYLQWTERSSKTRQGGEGGHVRPFAPKIYGRNDSRCPIKHYKLFASKRPHKAMLPDSPFYLTVRQGATLNDHVAYINGAMGVNKLRDNVKDICLIAGVPGRHTNHSLRKTTCQTLMSNNVPPVLVAQLSGHKSLSSLNNYTTATKPQQRAMSDILTGKRSTPPTSSDVLHPAKRTPIESAVSIPTSHVDDMIAPPPRPVSMPVQAANNQPQAAFKRLAENAAGMLSGAYVNAPITLNFNYNVHTNSLSQVNVSPKIPSATSDE